MLRNAKSSAAFRTTVGSSTGSGTASGSSAKGGSGGNASGLRSGSGSYSAGETVMHQNLGLHNAAATGNVGLVKFALDNGQPHASILNGLLPLHAACSGGSEAVVRLLLSYGADVNAARVKIPKGSGVGLGVGAEGSTPLHFAAANGHAGIVRLLLEKGARPSVKDKEGKSAEALASQQGHTACATLLRNWVNSFGPNGLARRTSAASFTTANASSSSLDPSNSTTSTSSPIRSQRSFEQLSSAAAGVKASLRNHKKNALAKVSSNPNLKASSLNSSFQSAPMPPPLPTNRPEQEMSGGIASASSSQPHVPSTIPANLLSREYKRRPSLPSIFERAGGPRATLSVHPPTAHRHPTASIEELAGDGSGSKGKTNASLTPPSPSRMTHRLNAKRSLTGLLRKTTGGATEASSSTDLLSPPKNELGLATMPLEGQDGGASPLPGTFASVSRGRSFSTDTPAPPLVQSLVHHDAASSSQISPASSTENFDGGTKQSGPVLYPFRPRKSSNLSTVKPSLFGQRDELEEGENTQRTLTPLSQHAKTTMEHGRKRSQSTTSVPKRPTPPGEREAGPPSVPLQQGTQQAARSSQDSMYDDAQEFLTSSTTAASERESQQTRLRNHARSPMLPTKSLAGEDVLLPGSSSSVSSPSFAARQLQSKDSSSSLVSSASSTNASFRQSKALPRPAADATTQSTPEDETGGAAGAAPARVDAVATPRSHRQPSVSESATSKGSNASMPSFGVGLTAQEQAQAILRSADGSATSTSGDGSTISLAQMLAAYGEALAQERRGVTFGQASGDVRKQASLASLSSNSRHHPLSSVHEASRPSPLPSTDSLKGSSTRVNQGSLTPFSTPPDSPQMARSRADSSATSFSRSPSSHRQVIAPRGIAEVFTDLNGKPTSPSALVPPGSTGSYLQVSDGTHKLPDSPLWVATTLDAMQGREGEGDAREKLDGTRSPPSFDLPAHRHSPSLPTDLSQFGGTDASTMLSSGIASTPRSGRKKSQRPRTADSHSSSDYVLTKRGVVGANDLFKPPPRSPVQTTPPSSDPSQGSPSKVDLKQGQGQQAGTLSPPALHHDLPWDANGSSSSGSKREDGTVSRSTSRSTTKRTVKAFLHGIKNNVVG